MGRRKIEIKAIKDDRNRSVTFLKRKGGLFKKAHELSVLCSVDVAVIIFGHNKKLYEFSSGDIHETIGRYQYYGAAHEHKGPEDFLGKRDGGDSGDEDEDVGSPGPQSHSPPEHAMIPHLHNQPPYQHMRHHTPSASPPMPNGMVFHPHRVASPQPTNISRPSSRAAHIRRSSSNLAPQANMQAPQPAPPQNSYAYMPNPPIYNPQAAAGLPVRGQPGQPGQPGPPGQPYPPQHQYTHPLPNPQVQNFQEEARRQSMPPAFPPQQEQRPPNSVPARSPPQPQHQPPPQHQPEQSTFQSPPLPQPKPLSVAAKSHSIFTPIDDSRSLLAQHWGSSNDPPRTEPTVKLEAGPRSQSIDTATINREQPNGRFPHPRNGPPNHVAPPPGPQRTASASSVPIIQPPSRTNSMQNDPKRPRLKVQIPSEHSDGEDATAGSSPNATNATMTPSRGPGEGGIVLPPPSPSASALLSAGATGPPNPFARPAPPGNNAFGNRNDNMDTPISALPSRFVADQLLPSPSSFYQDWGFGRGDNMLPSPLNFQTPVVTNGPIFNQDDNDRKRKTSEGSDGGVGKRIKA